MESDKPGWQENHEYTERHVRVGFRQQDAARHKDTALRRGGGRGDGDSGGGGGGGGVPVPNIMRG